MAKEVFKRFDRADVLVMAAAVSDFRPAKTQARKIKKSSKKTSIELEETTDILKALGERKKGQILIGFALETDNLEENAVKKLKDKSLDIIIANDESAFEEDSSKVIIIDRDGKTEELPKTSKKEIAKKILDKVKTLLFTKNLAARLA